MICCLQVRLSCVFLINLLTYLLGSGGAVENHRSRSWCNSEATTRRGCCYFWMQCTFLHCHEFCCWLPCCFLSLLCAVRELDPCLRDFLPPLVTHDNLQGNCACVCVVINYNSPVQCVIPLRRMSQRKFVLIDLFIDLHSVLWHCLLDVRKSIWAVKNWVMRCWHGYLSAARCKWFAYGPADFHCHPIISCFIKIQNSLTFLVLAY